MSGQAMLLVEAKAEPSSQQRSRVLGCRTAMHAWRGSSNADVDASQNSPVVRHVGCQRNRGCAASAVRCVKIPTDFHGEVWVAWACGTVQVYDLTKYVYTTHTRPCSPIPHEIPLMKKICCKKSAISQTAGGLQCIPSTHLGLGPLPSVISPHLSDGFERHHRSEC